MSTRSEYESQAKWTIQELEERVSSLRQFDACQEIDAYCDELGSEVMFAVESAIRHLGRLREKLLLEIECYRNELIAAQGAKQTDKKRKTQNTVKKDFDKLAKEVETFSVQSAAYLAKSKEAVDDSVVEFGRGQANEFRERAGALERRLRDLAFNKKFMKFNERKTFYLEEYVFGKLEIDDQDEQEYKRIVLDEVESKASAFRLEGPVNALCFLSNGNLVVCQADHPVAIWDVKANKRVLELKTILGECEAMAETPDGHLAIGDHECFINMLSLSKKKVVKRLGGNTDKSDEFWSIVALRVLSNGNLICQYSNGFAVWNHRAEANKWLVSKFMLDREQVSMSPFDLLDDEYILTSTPKQDAVVFSLLSSENGRVIRKYELPKESCEKYKFLPNADVMLFGKGGAVIKFNMINRSIQQVAGEDEGALAGIAKLSDHRPCLLFQRKSKLVKLAASENGRKARYASPFSCFAFSPDNAMLATGSNNGSLVFWALND